MDSLNNINFGDYDSDSDNENKKMNEPVDEYNENTEIDFTNLKNDSIESILNDFSLGNSVLKKLEIIHNSIKTIGQLIEYYIHNLSQIKINVTIDTIESAKKTLSDTTNNIKKIIELEIKKNSPFVMNEEGFYITNSDVNLYYVPKISFDVDNGLLIIKIFEKNDNVTLNLGYKYNNIEYTSDIYSHIDSAIKNGEETYNYFNIRYSKLSTTINYLSIILQMSLKK